MCYTEITHTIFGVSETNRQERQVTDNRFIDIHALQTMPPSNINRDGQGRPKTAVYGGIPRMRVSSQAWKHAIREDFRNSIDTGKLGRRSREFTTMIAQRLPEPVDEDKLNTAADTLMATLKLAKDTQREGCTKALQFFGEQQWQMLADTAYDAIQSGSIQKTIDEHKTDIRKSLDSDKAIDVALFGRMSASDDKGKATAYVVDAAVQVAHAISVNKAETEYDFYSAMDDCDGVSGFGFSDEQGFTSGTLYRYAAIDLRLLDRNFAGDKDMERLALQEFIRLFATSMPGGKKNSFAPNTMPAFVATMIRTDRPVSLVEAYEQPVKGDTMSEAVHRLWDQYEDYQDTFGLNPADIRITASGHARNGLDDELKDTTVGLDALIDGTVKAALED